MQIIAKTKAPKKASTPKAPKKASTPKKPPTVNPNVDVKRSTAIAESWGNANTALLRSTRNGVSVNGVSYTSTLKAFIALGLPVVKHIPFRGKLKKLGTLTFTNVVDGVSKDYNFTILPSKVK